MALPYLRQFECFYARWKKLALKAESCDRGHAEAEGGLSVDCVPPADLIEGLNNSGSDSSAKRLESYRSSSFAASPLRRHLPERNRDHGLTATGGPQECHLNRICCSFIESQMRILQLSGWAHTMNFRLIRHIGRRSVAMI